jgi:hypothetical protein
MNELHAISYNLFPTPYNTTRAFVYFEHDDLAVRILDSWKPLTETLNILSVWGGPDSVSQSTDPNTYVSWEFKPAFEAAVRHVLETYRLKLRFELQRS